MKKLSLLIIALHAFTFIINAQTSNLSIQGVLRTSEGDAVENGEYDITFKLYTEATTGDPEWEETIEGINVKGGVYSVILGANGKNLDAEFNVPYFLGVSVGGGTEMIPRAKLTSSPYALSLIGDDNIFPNSGNVGVGSATPQSKLTVGNEAGTLGFDVEDDITNNATISTKADGIEFSTEGADNAYYFMGEVTEVMRIKKDGKVGIGTDDPQSLLHVVGDNEQVKIEGTDNANIIFANITGNATLGFDAANGNNLRLSNAIGTTKIEGNQIELQGDEVKLLTTNGKAKLIGDSNAELSFHPQGENGTPNGQIKVLPDGNMEIQSSGIVQVNDHLIIDGETVAINPDTYFHASSTQHGDGYTPPAHADPLDFAFQVVSGFSLFEHGIIVTSDKRIKKDFKLSKGNKDLNRLMEIEVTDYRYIDEMQYGKEFKKGVVAQQIKEVFPEAVRQSVDFVPSIYTFPTQITKDKGGHTFTFAKEHQFEKGDLLKFIVGKDVVKTTVSEIVDKNSFSISNWDGGTETKEVFLYGHQIEDRLAVDHNEIFTLNVSATQELARQVAALETTLSVVRKENAQLKSANINSSKNNDALKAAVNLLSNRMGELENLLNSTGSN